MPKRQHLLHALIRYLRFRVKTQITLLCHVSESLAFVKSYVRLEKK